MVITQLSLDALKGTKMNVVDSVTFPATDSTTIHEFLLKNRGYRFYFSKNKNKVLQNVSRIVQIIKQGLTEPGNTRVGYQWAYDAVKGASWCFFSEESQKRLLHCINDKSIEKGYGSVDSDKLLFAYNVVKFILLIGYFVLYTSNYWSLLTRYPTRRVETLLRAVLFCTCIIAEVVRGFALVPDFAKKRFYPSSWAAMMVVVYKYEVWYGQ